MSLQHRLPATRGAACVLGKQEQAPHVRPFAAEPRRRRSGARARRWSCATREGPSKLPWPQLSSCLEPRHWSLSKSPHQVHLPDSYAIIDTSRVWTTQPLTLYGAWLARAGFLLLPLCR